MMCLGIHMGLCAQFPWGVTADLTGVSPGAPAKPAHTGCMLAFYLRLDRSRYFKFLHELRLMLHDVVRGSCSFGLAHRRAHDSG